LAERKTLKSIRQLSQPHFCICKRWIVLSAVSDQRSKILESWSFGWGKKKKIEEEEASTFHAMFTSESNGTMLPEFLAPPQPQDKFTTEA